MTPEHIESTTRISRFAVLLGFLSAALFTLFSFGPADVSLFDAGEELIFGPVMSLAVFVIAAIAYFRAEERNTWHYAAIVVGTITLVLWLGLNILFYMAYSNCSNGVC